MEVEDLMLDGSAVGGELMAVFGQDVTADVRTCAGCGTVAPLAAHMAYTQAAGIVLRCPGCDDVALTVVMAGERRLLTLSGTLEVRPGA